MYIGQKGPPMSFGSLCIAYSCYIVAMALGVATNAKPLGGNVGRNTLSGKGLTLAYISYLI